MQLAIAISTQGLEFVPTGSRKYPEDFPELGAEISVTGEFQTYYEGEDLYCHLINASLA